MAALNPAISYIGNHSVKVVWGPLTTTDTEGVPLHERFTDYDQRTVEADGTWGGATLKYQGSNRGTNYVSLADVQGTAFEKTANALEAIVELAGHQKPVVTGGDGTTALYCTLTASRRR